MKVTIWFQDRLVQATCPDNSLVYNGMKWIVPTVGDYATLRVSKPTVVPSYEYVVNEMQMPSDFRIGTNYVCMITNIEAGSPDDALELINEPDPTGGSCLCLVCNSGTQILNVKIA